jgi:cytochrome c553
MLARPEPKQGPLGPGEGEYLPGFEYSVMKSRSQITQLALVVCVVAVVTAVSVRQSETPGSHPTPAALEPLRTPNLEGALSAEERAYRDADLRDLTEEASNQPGFAQASHLIFERVSDDILQQGEALAKTHCTSCHGANLDEGEGVQHMLEGEQYRRAGLRYIMKYKYGWRGPAVYRSIKYGTSNGLMPAFEGVLSEDEILAVAHFIRSIQSNNPATQRNR